MILKFNTITNLAVFKNFNWDNSVKDNEGNIKELKKVNILYGRNYSGKTTLSRIVRAMETGYLSEKYENPEFSTFIKDENVITQDNLSAHNKKFRVFNEDFVKENLKFISNPDESIEPFAILGEGNNQLEREITELKKEIGSNKEDEETGLYKELKRAREQKEEHGKRYKTAQKKLNDQLSKKATDKEIGIKYKPERFGDQNYTIKKIEQDIRTIQEKNFQTITNEEKKQLEQLIKEKPHNEIQPLSDISLNFRSLSDKTKELVEKKVGKSDKIEELAKDAYLNKWAKKGKELHQERQICGFCGNEITDSRWKRLEKHFDQESEELENQINDLITDIEKEKSNVNNGFQIKKELFYSNYHSKVDQLLNKYSELTDLYNQSLDALKNQLIERKNDIINNKDFIKKSDHSERVESVFSEYERIRQEANQFTAELKNKQEEARGKLRLKEVEDFIKTIDYSNQIKKINALKEQKDSAENKFEEIQYSIEEKKLSLEEKKRTLNDEEQGAEKVNEYLNHLFGHKFLSLQAVKKNEDPEDSKQVKFEIIRDGKKAHHLSEGECSLLAFCYFMARLEDVNTKDEKPIIWIDDPISSLDSNHVFFIYSLINTELFSSEKFEQLFISTHNLDFLKYLKRLPGAKKTNENKTKYRYLIIQRNIEYAAISLMPKHLKEFITEFNYLFSQIYKCSKITEVDDSNHMVFYNFGNNARKFLELLLYFKYPDASSQIDKLQKFFGDKEIPSILTDRINNEYSHLVGVLERGGLPVEVPEMRTTAQLIIERIKTLDKNQYEALLNSIGELETYNEQTG